MRCFSVVLNVVMSPLCKLFRIAYLPFTGEYQGLGNRLKAIASVWTLGYRRILMAWRSDGWVDMPYDSLFQIKNCRICSFSSGGGYEILRVLFRRFLPTGIFCKYNPFWSFVLPKWFQREKYRHVWSFVPSPPKKNIYSIDFRFDEIDEDIREYYRPFFANLMPSEEVWRRIRMMGELPEDIVTVQVRNTDSKADAKEVCSIETIFTVMDGYSVSQKFFISTMNQSISQKFHRRYGERVMELPHKNPKSLIDAVADMWLLGRGREMIVSPCSTFSEVAWWWSGARIPVKHLKSEYNQMKMNEA